MHKPEQRAEIDFLLEHQNALQNQLNKVQDRLSILLDTVVELELVTEPPILYLVQGGKHD